MKKIKLDSFILTFQKKISQKSIRLRLTKKGELVLSAPYFCSEKKALAFAGEHLDWIKKQMSTFQGPKTFKAGDIISILGKECRLVLDPNQQKPVYLKENILFIPGNEAHLHTKVRTYIQYELLSYLQQNIPLMAQKINQKVLKIALRDTSSRWGSCSSNKTIHFCWKIGLAPLFVIDYLMAHEVSHLKEMNHSAQFWETVALFQTKRADAEIWLRKNGASIQAYK